MTTPNSHPNRTPLTKTQTPSPHDSHHPTPTSATAPRFFDYASTSPPYEAALAAAADTARQYFGNPSSSHRDGTAAREQFAALCQAFSSACGFHDGRLITTSGGTEANNLVLRGILERDPQSRLLLAANVHASAWFATERWPERTDLLPLDDKGQIRPQTLLKALTPRTALVSLTHACNETGQVLDAPALAECCARRGIPLHLDGVQALGHLSLNLSLIPCHYYTFSAHKFGGPRGFGGLFCRGTGLAPQISGGPQQDGLRAGTENLPGLAGALAALQCALATLPAETLRLRELNQQLSGLLRNQYPNLLLNSDPHRGLPGLLSFSLPGLDATALAADLDLQGFAVATGSACHSRQREPSRILLALGHSRQAALGSLRISLGWATTHQDVVALGAALLQSIPRCQDSR